MAYFFISLQFSLKSNVKNPDRKFVFFYLKSTFLWFKNESAQNPLFLQEFDISASHRCPHTTNYLISTEKKKGLVYNFVKIKLWL